MGFSSVFGRIAPTAEPMRSCHGDILVSAPAGSFRGGIMCRNLSPAGTSISPSPMLGRNMLIPIPGNKSSGSGSFSFFIFNDTEAWRFWKNWSKLIYDVRTDNVALFHEIAGTAVVSLHGPGGGKVADWTMEGCWPSNVTPSALDSQTEGTPASIDVTLECAAVR